MTFKRFGRSRLEPVSYLLKNLLRTELVETIRLVHSGHKRIPPEIAQQSPSMREMIRLRRVNSMCLGAWQMGC
jgi:DNA-binding NarL/FixJ family response regulator